MAKSKAGSGTNKEKGVAREGVISASTRVLILHGKQRFLQDEYLRELREALAAAHGGADAVDTVRFDGAGGGSSGGGGGGGRSIIAEIFDECRSFGLMQQYKIVLVENADALLKSAEDDDKPAAPKPVRGKGGARPPIRVEHSARELMESYAAAPSDSATLVLRAGTWRAGNLDKAVLALGDRGVICKCEDPEPDQAIRWAIKRSELRHRAKIDSQAAQMLVGAVGADFGRIDSELEKLATAAGGDGQPITADLVRAMTGFSREDDFWAIQRPLLAGDVPATLAQVRDLVEVSRHDPVALTWSLADAARKVHGMSQALAAGMNEFSAAGKLKLWGDATRAVTEAARRIKPRDAAALFAHAIHTDAANKSGLGEPFRNLEVAATRLGAAISNAS